MISWLLLTAALPTSPSGLRVRIWRALKATGCATLRDGVYLLPAPATSAADFCALEPTIRAAGAEAHLLRLEASDAAQEAAFIALFDRAPHYADFMQSLKEARRSLAAGAHGASSGTESAQRKLLRQLEQRLQTITASDFFPGKAAAAAVTALQSLRQQLERRFSPDEPGPAGAAVPPLRHEDFQGRTWATRRRPWVDRLATAWLIRRFVDGAASFVWLVNPKNCPPAALGFDFDGARFTHSGGKVSFEVVARAFGLDADAGLRRLGELVHFIDVGGIPVDEAAGVEALVRGLQARHADDDGLLEAALPLFDALYTALGAAT